MDLSALRLGLPRGAAREITAVLHQAGLVELRWLMPADSGFYQPLVLARNATAAHPASSDWSR
jgi:hypothetical protein